MPSVEKCPEVRIEVLVEVKVSFRVRGGNQTIVPEENSSSVGVRVWIRANFGVGRQFSSRTIVLEACGRFSVFSNVLLLHLF